MERSDWRTGRTVLQGWGMERSDWRTGRTVYSRAGEWSALIGGRDVQAISPCVCTLPQIHLPGAAWRDKMKERVEQIRGSLEETSADRGELKAALEVGLYVSVWYWYYYSVAS